MTGPNVAPVTARVGLDFNGLEQAFPEVDPGLIPFGHRVLVQIRSAKDRTAGGLYIPEETRETELWNTQVAKVIAVGPVAFHNRDTLEKWPEGEWCQVGDYVRVPKYGGDKWYVDLPDATAKELHVSRALFCLFHDTDIIGKITGDPLEVVAFL